LVLAVSSRISDSPRPEEINFSRSRALPGRFSIFEGHTCPKGGFQDLSDQAEDKTEAEDNPKVEVKAKVEADQKNPVSFTIFKMPMRLKRYKSLQGLSFKERNVHPKISAGFNQCPGGRRPLSWKDSYGSKRILSNRHYRFSKRRESRNKTG
jgi:hypothetical protein